MQCPNPECRYAKRVGRPAEYRAGITSCSDCGAPLVDRADVHVVSTSSAAGATGRGGHDEATHAPLPASAARAVVVTAVACLVPLALLFVPLPYVEREVLLSHFSSDDVGAAVSGSAWWLTSLSVGAIGVTTWTSSALLVEIVAFLVPPLRRRRHAGPRARAGLERAALAGGALIALAQSWSLVMYLAAATGAFHDSVAPELWSWGPRLLVLATLVGAACVCRLAAFVIDRHGMGNGIVLVAGGALLLECGREIVRQVQTVSAYDFTPLQIVVTVAVLIAPVALVWRFVEVRAFSRAGDAPVEAMFVARPTSGVIPATIVFALPIALATLGQYVDSSALQRSEPILLLGAGALIAAALVPLLSSLWASPQRAATWFAVPEHDARLEAREALVATWALNGGLVVAFALATLLLPYGLGALPVLSLVTLTAIARDLLVESRWRRVLDAEGRAPVAVGSLHRLDVLGPVLADLAREGISVGVRGAHVRALSHFFAPWVPLDLFVRAEDAERAATTIARTIDRLGLAVK